jgi:pentatricopeptide repeat protein
MSRQKDISFRYVKDGCFARAHLMVRRMQSQGVKPAKVWAIANPDPLTIKTRTGLVTWKYHVAPIVRVRYPEGERDMVIDPSMFNKPVTIADWRAAMHRPGASQPFITRTRLGQAPMQPNGVPAKGTGYWLGADPPTSDLDAFSRAEMAKDLALIR